MLFQLPNGKCVEISVDQYLTMSDEELNALMKNMLAFNAGEEVSDPFAISVLKFGDASHDEWEDLDDFEEMPIEDLTDIEDAEKLVDPDYIDFDNIEE
jgi:hypothetical protein